MDYEQLTDEQLVEKVQEGDDYAFTVLFKRFQGALKYNAKKASYNYPFSKEDFFEYFQERFQTIVLKFDFRGTIYFATFCKVMFPKFVTEYVRDNLRRRKWDDGVLRRTEEPSKLALAKENEFTTDEVEKIAVSDFRNTLTHDYLTSEVDTDLYNYLQTKDETYGKIVLLSARGYTYPEIATLLGKEGSYSAKKSWVKRQMESIRTETISFYMKSGAPEEVIEYIS